MKSGFHSEIPRETEEVQRADQNIPLNKFGLPSVNWEAIKKKLELPDQYLRTCTLREGTIITMCIYQTMSLGTVAFMFVLLIVLPNQTDEWVEEKFRNDLDYYYQDEHVELIKTLWPLWKPITYAIIVAHIALFMTGWLVVYALARRNNAHPLWYMPWITVSTFLSTVHWLMTATQILVLLILAFYRDISVTWDLVPLSCTIVYGVGWTYSCAVVIAHYKRRCIVQYWKKRQDLIGSDTHPPEITQYLYQYAKPR